MFLLAFPRILSCFYGKIINKSDYWTKKVLVFRERFQSCSIFRNDPISEARERKAANIMFSKMVTVVVKYFHSFHGFFFRNCFQRLHSRLFILKKLFFKYSQYFFVSKINLFLIEYMYLQNCWTFTSSITFFFVEKIQMFSVHIIIQLRGIIPESFRHWTPTITNEFFDKLTNEAHEWNVIYLKSNRTTPGSLRTKNYVNFAKRTCQFDQTSERQQYKRKKKHETWRVHGTTSHI